MPEIRDFKNADEKAGFIAGLEAARSVALDYDEGSVLFSGFTWESYAAALSKAIDDLRGCHTKNE